MNANATPARRTRRPRQPVTVTRFTPVVATPLTGAARRRAVFAPNAQSMSRVGGGKF